MSTTAVRLRPLTATQKQKKTAKNTSGADNEILPANSPQIQLLQPKKKKKTSADPRKEKRNKEDSILRLYFVILIFTSLVM